jgi:transaldolase
VSPLLAHDTASTIAAAKKLSARAGKPNLFIKIPGTKEGLPAIEEAIFAGVPVNVTLLFSREQYVAAAEAYLRGIERRIAAGLNPQVGSVASMFISRWDVAVVGKVPKPLNNRLGIAIAGRIYQAYLELLNTPRSQRAYNAGARPQRLLWASTGTKDPKASDILYIKALASPFTVNTMPEATLKALADHGDLGRVCQGRHQCGQSGRATSGRGRKIICEILERIAGGDRVQERRAQAGRLTRQLNQLEKS